MILDKSARTRNKCRLKSIPRTGLSPGYRHDPMTQKWVTTSSLDTKVMGESWQAPIDLSGIEVQKKVSRGKKRARKPLSKVGVR